MTAPAETQSFLASSRHAAEQVTAIDREQVLSDLDARCASMHRFERYRHA